MTKEEIITALEQLVNQEMSKEVSSQGKPILEAYQANVTHQLQEQKENFITEGGLPEDFKLERDELDIKFDQLWADYSKSKKEHKEKLQNAEKENFSFKEELIKTIENLKTEEHIKKAHESFKEIEQKWKNAGRIPQDKVKELDAAYSKARDEFFYNMHIYKELLENDLKKNLQLKEEIVNKMKATTELKSFKDMDSMARRLTNQWNEIGPTYKEKWEGVRDQFWEAHHEVFNKIKDFYKTQKEKQKENLEKKQALLSRLLEVNSFNITSEKSWKKHTTIVLELQKDWRSIGFAPKTENEKIWTEFKLAADSFFSEKSSFYGEIKASFDNNKSAKEDLIQKAEGYLTHDNPKSAANALTDLQKKWREIGAAHHRDEQRLWKKFRSVCNSFFENRKTQQKQEAENQVENLKLKSAVVDEISNLAITNGDDNSLSKIDELILKFNQIGFVPMNEKQKIAVDYKNAIHKKLSELGIPEEELSDYLFSVKINELAGAQNPEKALEKEAHHVREKTRTIKANILQYENNLGFFKNSKGANTLKEEVEQKIANNKLQLIKLESKLKMIYQNME
ncbi:MAG: hypothetical protein ACI85Q_000339 [Salibacteraceae bacterium]|jgi:hypothetical protein